MMKWRISGRHSDIPSADRNDSGYFVLPSGSTQSTENIVAGSVINLDFNGNMIPNLVSSSNYDNIEDWYFGENISEELEFIAPEAVFFRRGTVVSGTGGGF